MLTGLLISVIKDPIDRSILFTLVVKANLHVPASVYCVLNLLILIIKRGLYNWSGMVG